MRRLIPIIISVVLLLSGCASAPMQVTPEANEATEVNESNKIKIVATLFPQYDFAREIAGESADITLLLPPGTESHSFEPTPSDIIKINECDIFLYTGDEMEPWAAELISSPDFGGKAVNVISSIYLDEDDDHDRDPHVWTDPYLAAIMADNITDSLSATDPENSEKYNQNLKNYKEQLQSLDSDFASLIANAQEKEMVFGGKFAFHYFVKRYHLGYIAAFDSCSNETEPSAKVLATLINEIKARNLKAVFYDNLESTKICDMICSETGAKALLFHSCHNITKDEFDRGESYLSLMRQNLEHLKEGLS